MDRLKIKAVFLILLTYLFISLPGTSSAGLFDDLQNKAKEMTNAPTSSKSDEPAASGISSPGQTGSGSGCSVLECGDARPGSCKVCCHDKYMTSGYPKHTAHAQVDKKFKKVSKSSEAAEGASKWLGVKHAKFMDKSDKGPGDKKHHYCWPVMSASDLPAVKSTGYIFGEFSYNKCTPITQCLHQTMDCYKLRSETEFTCTFDLNEIPEKNGKCLISESAYCPEMKR